MTDNLTGPQHFARAGEEATTATFTDDTGEKIATYLSALVAAQQAHTAAVVMLAENRHEYAPYEVEAWREVIPLPDLKECKGKETRRPACAKWHTEDCHYSDPVISAGTRVIHRARPAGGARMGTVREQERDATGTYHLRVEWDSGKVNWIAQTDVVVIRHERLPVGTRVLVFGSMTKYDGGRIKFEGEPWAGKILGHSPNGTYKIAREYGTGRYGEDYPSHVFMDERVSVHPEGPECPKPDGYTEPEPTGPRVYIQRFTGKQGHVVELAASEQKPSGTRALVHWYSPGEEDSWVELDNLKIIHESDVARCEHGQTGDECGEGENRCELCLAAEDAEAEAIEESMGR